MSGKLTVSYHLPGVGLLQTTLHNESRSLYEFLDGQGEIERLKQLDHLGLVRRAWEGAHHPRWEYVMLIMRLAEMSKDHVKEAHLAADLKLDDETQVSSGVELLKCWAMLLNIGHFVWTFTAEKAFLAEVKRSSRLRRELLSAMPDADTERYARNVLRDEDVYAAYHLLCFLQLSSWKGTGGFQVAWRTILKAYCLGETNDPGVRRALRIYRQIRTLAYLILDPAYTPSLVSVDSTELITNPRRLGLILYDSDSPLMGLMRSIQHHLFENVYLSDEVTIRMCGVMAELRRQIRLKGKGGLSPLIRSLFKDEIQRGVRDESDKLKRVMSLSFVVERPFTDLLLKPVRPLTEEKKWLEGASATVRDNTTVTVWPFADNLQKVVNVFVEVPPKPHSVQRSIGHVIGRLAKAYDEHLQEFHEYFSFELLQDLLYGRIALSLIRALLRESFEFDGRWELAPPPGGGGPLAAFSTDRTQIRAMITSRVRALSRQGGQLPKARANEFRALRRALATERARAYAVLLGNATAFGQDGKPVAELDGVYVTLAHGKPRLVVIEAKATAKGSKSKIERQMRRTMRQIALRGELASELRHYKRSSAAPPFGKCTLHI